MNLLLEHSKFVEFYTYLGPIFEAAPELTQVTYLISNLDAYGSTDPRFAATGPLVISGRELQAIVEKEKVQFVWAVLSAFDHEPKVPDELPYADGNSALWGDSPKPQIAEAKFEIVCWDSGATLFIGVEAATAARLRARVSRCRIYQWTYDVTGGRLVSKNGEPSATFIAESDASFLSKSALIDVTASSTLLTF